MEDTLLKIQNWYIEQCDGDWEHSFGLKIDTLDNPGWTVSIDTEDSTNRVGSGFYPAVPPHHLAYVLRTKAVSTKLPLTSGIEVCGSYNSEDFFFAPNDNLQ